MATQQLIAIKSAVMAKDGTFSGWNGKDNHLQLGATSSGIKWRAVMRFPIWELPNNITSIDDVQLRLYSAKEGNHSYGNNTAQIKIGRMTADWSELTNDPGDGYAASGLAYHWDNRYNKFTNSKVSGNRTQPADGVAFDDISMNNIFDDWMNGAANYGIILINETSETNSGVALLLRSDEYANGKPRLVVTYSTNTAPTAITDRYPEDLSTVNTLTPTFTASMTDAENDDVTSYRIIVKSLADGTTYWDTGKTAVETGDYSIAVVGNSISIPYGTGGGATALVPGVTYEWAVSLWDEGDENIGSDYIEFTTNALPNAPTVTVTPTPLSAVPDSTPNFSIIHNDPDPADTLMDGYTCTVEAESALGVGDWSELWSTGDIDVSGSPSSSVNVTSTTLDWGGSYRIFARTQDGNGAWGAYSSPVTFQVQKTAVPITLSPSGGSTTPVAPTLAGARGQSADTISKFSLRVYTADLGTAMLSETEYTTGTNGNTFSKLYAGTALTAGSAYKWSAKVYSDIGGYSDWSDWQDFTVEADVSVPTITSPVGDNDYSLTPTITFNRSANFDYYDVEIYPETATEGSLGTPHDTDTNNSQTAATSASYTYAGTALEWATGYKIRARVSPNAGTDWSNWSGLYFFATEAIDGPPVLVNVETDTNNPAWINTPSPEFNISRYASDANSIDKAQVRIWNSNGTSIEWDSGLVDVADAATAAIEYTAGLLTPGTTYKWDARYQNDVGPISPYSGKKEFRLNGAPSAPTGLFPPSGYVYYDSESKTFRAEFDDPDEGTFGDYPADWEIKIWNDDTDAQHGSTQSVTSELSAGANETTWAGTALAEGVNYSWSARFQDSKGEWGAWSAYQGFRVSTPPNGTISTPSDGSVVSSVTPEITWTITGNQSRYTIKVEETDNVGTAQSTVTTLEYFNDTDTSDSVTLPAGYLENGKYYNITLKIWNSDNLVDPSASTVNVYVNLDAPDPIQSIDSLSSIEDSYTTIYWDLDDEWGLALGHTFVGWRVKRRRSNFTSWETIADIPSQATKQYTDYYAGHNINYQYAIYAVTRKSGAGLELVSGDDSGGGNIITAQIASPDWHFIGADRAAIHNSLLVVEEESHNRPIQQEVFETLGSDRKVIMRGFVLGNEGSITTLWFNQDVVSPEDEQLTIVDTYRGRRIVDYLTRVPGPHIIKSPFGDVWDVQFATPEYEWLPTGHLSVSLEWIETGTTSENEY